MAMANAETDVEPTQVEYRYLGKAGLRVSVPIIGTMSFGSDKWMPWVKNEPEAMKVLKAAWDRGINTIDTANMYSNGETERIIGKFIKQYNIPRSKILIFTKCYGLVHDDISLVTAGRRELRNQREYVNQSGLSRQAIFNAVDESLKRLDTPYIDLLQIHRYDPNVPMEEVMKALHDLVQSGKVRYIGATSMRAWQFVELNHVAERHGWTKFVSMQCEYSLLYREDEREMIPYCNAHGIGLIPWAPLHEGKLARPYGSQTTRTESFPGSKLTEVDKAIIGRVEEVAKKKGWEMAQVALAWVCSKVASPVVGVNSPERLENLVVREGSLTSDEIKYLEELYQPKPVRNHG